MKHFSLLLVLPFLLTFTLRAQSVADSSQTKRLHTITVTGRKANIERLPPLKETFLFSGKKTEVITLSGLNANITEKTPRQLLPK